MLDEVIEYREYIDKDLFGKIIDYNKNEKSSKNWLNVRLKYNQMSNDFSGLKRAYTIIAKHLLSKYEDADIALNGLYAYAGLKYEQLVDELNELANYINPYLFEFYIENSRCTGNDSNLDLINSLRDKYLKKRLDEDIINEKSIAAQNGISDFNKISFTDIVDNLLCKQDYSMKRKVLVCKEDLTKGIVNKKGKRISSKQEDFLLKLIAAYLIFKKDNGPTRIILSDVYNWTLYNHESNELNNYVFKDNKMPIIKTIYNKMAFIDVCDEIKQNYYLLDYSEVDNLNYGDIVYVDRGAKDILMRVDIENTFDKIRLLQELKDIS